MRTRELAELERARWLCVVGFLSATSFCLMSLSIAVPHAPYLRYDPADVPALLAGCAMGPLAGLAVVAMRDLLRLILINPDLVGLTMNLVASGTFVVVVGTLYGWTLTRLGAVIAIACGTVGSTIVMVCANTVVLPLYLGIPGSKVAPIVLSTIVPFNLVKGLANGVLVFLLYKKISPHLPRYRSARPLGTEVG